MGVSLPRGDSAPVITVEGLSKKFSRGYRAALSAGVRDITRELAWWTTVDPTSMRANEFWALQDISMTLYPGDALAVIGGNGAGKSTLLKLIGGLLKPDRGRIAVRGRLRAIIELGGGFDPALSGRENIYAQGALYGYRNEEIKRSLDEIIDFSGLEGMIDSPIQQYSDGMRARLGFAVAVNLEPDILLLDEVLAVGDLSFQNKCLRRIREFRQRGGTIIFVGHGSHQVQSACRTGIVLVKGEAAFAGDVVDALDFYFKTQRPGLENGGVELTMPRRGDEAERVSINLVEVASLDANPVTQGSTIRVRLQYTSTEEIANVLFGFNFYSEETGASVAATLLEPMITLERGTHWLSCHLADSPIAAGDYLVRAYLIDNKVDYPLATTGWDDAAFRLNIQAEPSVRSNLTQMAKVHVYLRARWEDQ